MPVTSTISTATVTSLATMSKKLAIPAERDLTLGKYTLTATGLQVAGRPSFEEHEAVGLFIKRTHQASGWWLADWLRYGESRGDWQSRIDQAVDSTGLTLKTLQNVRAIGAIEPSRRVATVAFSLHGEVAGLAPTEQTAWLERAESEGWTQRELRQAIKAHKRTKIIEGQALLAGQYRVVYADPPWLYGDRPPSGSGAQEHYPGMTIDELCKLPVASHVYRDAVLFLWVTAPFMLLNPGPREVIEAWGFEYKTGAVWDKVRSGGGHYFAVKHEHLLVCTRGSCVPDRPSPSPDSVQTIRREGEHSEKPAEFRKIIEGLYDGPYLELFGRKKVPGWTVFGNDARLWGG